MHANPSSSLLLKRAFAADLSSPSSLCLHESGQLWAVCKGRTKNLWGCNRLLPMESTHYRMSMMWGMFKPWKGTVHQSLGYSIYRQTLFKSTSRG